MDNSEDTVSTSSRRLRFDSLALERIIVEVRYKHSPWLWDRSGLVWTEINKAIPDLLPINAEPATSSYRQGRKLNLTIHGEKTSLTGYCPATSTENFCEVADKFFPLVFRHLEVDEFTRLGMRLIFSKKYSEKVEAANAVLSLNLLNKLSGKHFEIEGDNLDPEYQMRWEGKTKGVLVRLGVQRHNLQIDIPPEITWHEPIKEELNKVMFDVDYYTVVPARAEQVRLMEWIQHSLHVVRRDGPYFFKG